MTANAARTTNGAKPPTLGDRLAEVMVSRNETASSVARRLGVTPELVDQWADDRAVPTGELVQVLATFLDVDVAEVRRLVLRSQMRHVQRDIRRGTGPAGNRP